MVVTGAFLKYLNANLVIIILAIIFTIIIKNYLYEKYLLLKYPDTSNTQSQIILISKSIVRMILLGALWMIVFTIITLNRGNGVNAWSIFMAPVFISIGVSYLWFFVSIRKISSSYKWGIFILGIFFTTLFFPINLIRLVQSVYLGKPALSYSKVSKQESSVTPSFTKEGWNIYSDQRNNFTIEFPNTFTVDSDYAYHVYSTNNAMQAVLFKPIDFDAELSNLHPDVSFMILPTNIPSDCDNLSKYFGSETNLHGEEINGKHYNVSGDSFLRNSNADGDFQATYGTIGGNTCYQLEFHTFNKTDLFTTDDIEQKQLAEQESKQYQMIFKQMLESFKTTN